MSGKLNAQGSTVQGRIPYIRFLQEPCISGLQQNLTYLAWKSCMLAQKSCKLQEKWPQSCKNMQESYKHWLARLLASLVAQQDINLACKNLTRVMQDFYRNLAWLLYCMHMDCCYGNQLLHPRPFSLQLFYTIIRSYTHYNNNIVQIVVHLWSLKLCLYYYSRQSGSQCLSENSCGVQGACSPDQLPE